MASSETIEHRYVTFIVRGSDAALARLFEASRAYQNRHNGRCLISGSSPISENRGGYEVQTDQGDLLLTVADAAGVEECFERVTREREHEIREKCYAELPDQQRQIEQTVKNLIEKKLHNATVPADMFVGLAEAWRILCRVDSEGRR